jgi:hypothetical protein
MFSEIPKLASSADYPRWAQTVQAYLGIQKGLKVLTKTAPTPDGTNDDAVET